MEYEIGPPIEESKVPVKARKRHASNEKLYDLLNNLTDTKWIPVTCKDKESARILSNAVRAYYNKRKSEVEFRYENNKVYIRIRS